MNKAVLLDRDGTLVEHVPYLSDPDQVVLERGVVEALRRLHRAGYLLIVVTNQSGIGRGLFTEADFEAVQERLRSLLLAEGIPLRATYHCPHHPTEALGEYRRECACRKPGTGMLEAAIAEHDLDRESSYMVGDHAIDVLAGQRAGLKSILVQTGLGDEGAPGGEPVHPDHVAADLLDAVVRFIRP